MQHTASGAVGGPEQSRKAKKERAKPRTELPRKSELLTLTKPPTEEISRAALPAPEATLLVNEHESICRGRDRRAHQ